MSNLPPPPFEPPGEGQPTPPPFAPPPAPSLPPPASTAPPTYNPPPTAPFAPPSAAPPPFGAAAAGAESPPPSPGSSKRKVGLIAGLVVVAGLAGGGILLATRNDDSSPTAATAEETEASEETEPAVESIPDSSTPDTETPATESTEAETTTTSFVVPEGAIDLGHQVYLPVPDGWSQTDDDQVTTITDGTTTVAVQVLAREPGEAPADLMQEYVNTFDTDFELVSYEPAGLLAQLGDDLAINDYSMYYQTWDPSDGVGLVGTIDTYIRADGLTAIVDVYGDENVGTPPDEMWDGLETSLSEAPQIAAPVELTSAEPFRVTTTHPFVQVDGLVGFTPAPGFNPVTTGNGQALASNGTYDFDVRKLTGQADVNAAVAAAQAILAESYTGLTFAPPTPHDPDSNGVVQQGVSWSGTYVGGGQPSSGAFDVFYDPATQNAYVVFRNWFNVTPGDPTEPNASEGTFMSRSIFNSFTTIP
jgi:hypothetical protein